MHENRSRVFEARRVGELLQIRGDRPGGKWRNAETPEDVDAAEQILERGGRVEMTAPSPEDVERTRAALDRMGTPSPAQVAAAARASELMDHPIRETQEAPTMTQPVAAPPTTPAGAARPISFLLEGEDVPASQTTLDAALALARSIAADAEAHDKDRNAKTAWKAGRVYLGDLLRGVLTFEFGAPEAFPDGRGSFAVLGARS